MTEPDYSQYFNQQLTAKDFQRLSQFIHSNIGIKMPEAKKGMIEGRLRKRLRLLKLQTYSEYCEYLFTPEGLNQELQNFIDVITTNKTDFFREPDHFDFLVKQAVPSLLHKYGSGLQTMNIWSAASSSGNEAYTIAMVLSEFGDTHPGFDFSILGTDISTDMLREARLGVYPAYEIEPVPERLRKKYLLRSKDRRKNLVRICPKLRSKIVFRQLNLMDKKYRVIKSMDAIFCRNVMIYFDKATQESLISRLYTHLRPGGYLFVGHSEVLHNCKVTFRNVAPAVYQKIQ